MAAVMKPGIEVTQGAVEQFLFREAEVLDDWKLSEWLTLLAPDIDYRIPVRTTREAKDDALAFSDETYHMIEDFGSLSARMRRLVTGAAFSESPPSRVRRHISNVRLGERTGAEIQVRSNLLFFWSRDDMQRLVSAERRDILRMASERFLLAQRRVLLDHVTLPLPNLSVVL